MKSSKKIYEQKQCTSEEYVLLPGVLFRVTTSIALTWQPDNSTHVTRQIDIQASYIP